MTREEALELRRGELIVIHWPGSNTGDNRKKAKVGRVNASGLKVGVHVERTTTKGAYTGQYGKELRWIYCEEVLERDTFGGAP